MCILHNRILFARTLYLDANNYNNYETLEVSKYNYFEVFEKK